MPYYVLQRTIDALNGRGMSIKGARILILGIAYKKNVDDTRESPSLKLIELYRQKGALVDYNDPYVPRIPKLRRYNLRMSSVPLDEKTLSGYDAVVIAPDHADYDYKWIYANAKLLIDTRNATKASMGDKKVVKA